MNINIGFQFSKAAKTWLAAFLINASVVLPIATTDEGDSTSKSKQPETPRYELMDKTEVSVHEQEALKEQDKESYLVFKFARIALEETEEGLRATPNDLPSNFQDNLYTTDNQGESYKIIDPAADVDWTEFELAQKTATIIAEKVPPGTTVETIMANGLIESKKTAGPEGGYRVTNPSGEQYLVGTAKFEERYEATDVGGQFRPKPDPRKIVHTNENVAFNAPWGEEMKIRSGGVLVFEDIKQVYGIQPDEYNQTYGPA